LTIFEARAFIAA